MSLSPEEIAHEESHIHDNRAYQLIVPIALFGLVAFACVVLRPVARRSSRVSLGLDDFLILASMFFGIGLVITAGLTTTYGIGRHIIAVPPRDLVKFGEVNFALEVFYVPTIALAKLSILALYVRVFRMMNKTFRIAVYVISAWIILWFIGLYLDIFLACRPISSYWEAHCAPSYTTSIATSVTNIISDVALLVLPQPQIWNLQMPLKKKLSVSFLMLLGVLATALSIARIPILRAGNQGGSPDLTYNLIDTYVFTVCEPMTIIICACLPVMQNLFRKAYSDKFGLSSLRSLLLVARGSNRTDVSTRSWSKIHTPGSENVSKETGSTPSIETPLRNQEEGFYELNPLPKSSNGVLDASSKV
ncbi:MAG: hypothetical protein ASARMPRED_003940 [Alectoria sarmentosa]|nr:MAG: hypothetical protein ASARMPRED_003940 [Alectoria sarmentosa]